MNEPEFRALVTARARDGDDFDPGFPLALEPDKGDYQKIPLGDAMRFLEDQMSGPVESAQPVPEQVYQRNLKLIGL